MFDQMHQFLALPEDDSGIHSFEDSSLKRPISSTSTPAKKSRKDYALNTHII